MSQYDEIAARAERVLDRCRAASRRSGRAEDAVILVAVAKTQPLDRARAVLAAGVRDIGENRVQEAQEKWGGPERARVRLHLVGGLQRNKARSAVALFDVVHSCDSLRLADRLSRMVGAGSLDVLLEVNVAGEPQKAGFAPMALRREIELLAALPGLQLRGLMTIAPATQSSEAARPHFAALRQLSDELRGQHPALGENLSMGMTDDFEAAIEEGATLVRVGRAIYGERNSHG
ncbi:MAG: YggS family pyridoxal phosphate-dependent enzyme [Chloroflexota bacterium]|nr:YggS family pyridoxal phosphate-dependent enzyme [Chloroflexota bacterium]